MAETIQKNTVKRRILDAAEKLFGEMSFPGLRMEELSSYMGMSRKTLYNHFPGGKREIWHSCVNRQIERFAKKMDEVVNDRNHDYIERGLSLLNLGREAFDVFNGSEGLIRSGEEQELFYPLLRERYVRTFAKFFSEGVELGILNADLPIQSLSEVIISLITAWGRQGSPLQKGESASFPEFVEQVLFTGILSEKGRGLVIESGDTRGRAAGRQM